MILYRSPIVWSCLVLQITVSGLRGDEPILKTKGEKDLPSVKAALTLDSSSAAVPVPPSLPGDTGNSASTTEAQSATTPDGFVPLLADFGFEGWIVQEGKQSAWQRDGELLSCVSAAGGWLRTDREYSDFVLRLEYRLQAGGNTGIGIRSPAVGNPTFTSLEVQLIDDEAPKYADLRPDQYTGSIYYQVPALHRARLNRIGEWNACEIRCLGDELTVKINGDVVNEVHLVRNDEKVRQDPSKGTFSLSQRPPLGHIALQSHSTRVDFRNIELKDLTVRTKSGLHYVELAEGSGEPVTDAPRVSVHYVGQLADGKRFTDTRDLGKPVTVSLEAAIDGWQEGLQGMKVGGKRRLIVPPGLAYGSRGVEDLIPPDATLVFEVELCAIER